MTFNVRTGASPLIISMPHSGTEVPPEVGENLTHAGRQVADTDWHVPQLYNFLESLDVTVLIAGSSRYVADVNRPADGSRLYPGRFETSVCPIRSFAGESLYLKGAEPDQNEIRRRIDLYWKPYHERLASELERVKRRHGFVVLLDAHSIRDRVPLLFDGKLPDFNFGSGEGASCAASLTDELMKRTADFPQYSAVLNGRFKGGYITRHYGKPEAGIHAVQLELSQRTYMDQDPPFTFIEERAAEVRPALRSFVEVLMAWKS